MNDREFEKILLDDEYVIKTYKPNSKRLALGNFFFILWSLLPVAAIIALVIFLTNRSEVEFDINNMVPIFVFFSFYLLLLFFIVFTTIANGIKMRYAITNKRLIMRKGAFGERFICLDLSAIKTKDVKIGLLDKWVHPNTGRLIYSTNEVLAYTIKNVKRNINANNIGIIVFSYIEDPFEVFKYINRLIDQEK